MTAAATPSGAPADIAESTMSDIARAYTIIDKDEDNDEAPAKVEPEPSGKQDGEAEASEAEEPEETPEQPKEPAAKTYKVKVNGETREVDEQELIAGYSRLEDYKAKTATTAREREAAEADRKALSTERQRIVDQFSVVIQHAQQFDPILAEGSKINWAQLAQQDPVTYQEKWPPYFHRTQQLQAMATERNRLIDAERREFEAKQGTMLIEKLPEWADAEKRKAAWGDIVETMTAKYGFSAEELGQTRDHRAIVMAHDLVRLHKRVEEMEKAKKTAETKKAEPSKSVKPGAAQDQTQKQSPKLAALKKQALRHGDTRSTLAFLNAAVADLPEEQ